MDKIYNYMNKYFDLIKSKIKLFLNNYVIFLELHYNLIAIQEELDGGLIDRKVKALARHAVASVRATLAARAAAVPPPGILLGRRP